MARILEGNEQLSTITTTTQVYKATHDGEGNRLPLMYRSFISFSYGGKNIEDFDLIASIDQDQLVKPIYGKFEDITTQTTTLDGQYYWGTHFTNNDLQFVLVTDGMTQQELDNFREWFAPGVMRELILAEHPNRAIMARVAEQPSMGIIPFEQPTTIRIANIDYSTSTTLYKGHIDITFIMDEPYWYSKLTYMPSYVNKNTLEALSIDSADENKIDTIRNKDMLKIMVEDGIPHQSILETPDDNSTFFLGNNILVTESARVEHAIVGATRLGIITRESTGLNVNNNTLQYLFYSGTAKSYPIIQFTLTLDFYNNYISSPANKILSANAVDFEYSYIAIDNKKMYFTTPSILTGYNQAIKIFSNITNNTSMTELLERIKLEVNEYYSRAWAIKCINEQGVNKNNLLSMMRTFFQTSEPTATFIINSKTGEAIGKFKINNGSNNYEEIEQNVGDMIRSDYLIIEGRNQTNDNGEIILNNCKQITSNLDLTNVLIFFKNMYL